MTTLKTVITTRYILKISAFILGFSFWYILSQSRPIEITSTIPLTFYGNNVLPEQLETLDTVNICIKGYKADFYDLDFENLAVHINADTLHIGKNYIQVLHENLFLPHHIKLLHCNPSNVVVIVKNT